MSKLNFHYNEETDEMIIEGIRYTGELFRDGFSRADGKTLFALRREGTVVCVKKLRNVTPEEYVQLWKGLIDN